MKDKKTSSLICPWKIRGQFFTIGRPVKYNELEPKRTLNKLYPIFFERARKGKFSALCLCSTKKDAQWLTSVLNAVLPKIRKG
jgi:hypothetical protein